MKYFAIFLPLFFIGFIGVVFPQTLAMCDYNKDWPQAPCLDTPPYTIEEKKLAWNPYYEYKGSVWMEEKKLEMINAIETGTFHEWVEKPDDYSHWNVYEYYSIFEGYDYAKYPQEPIEQKSVALESIIPPPLKQIKLGIKLGHIICDKDKSPVWNIRFKPACVFPDSEMKLLERGWAKLRLVLPGSGDPIKELEWTGQNEVTYKILGNIRYGDESPPSTLDEKKKIVWEYAQQYHPGERFLEYSISTSGLYHFNVGDKVQFDLLEWGNYSECWNLKLRIIDIHDQPVYEDNSVRFCLEPLTDGQPGWFASYSMGQEFDEFVCDKTGYYRIEVSNGEIFPPTILKNFACLGTE